MINFKKYIFLFWGIFTSFSMVSCDSQMVYERYVDYDNNAWNVDSTAVFHFDIENTTDKYNLIAYVRNTSDYPYQNIYLKYSLIQEDSLVGIDSLIPEKMKDVQLFKVKTGEPFGKVEQSIGNSSTGAIYTHPVYIKKNFMFDKKGEYIFNIKHYMRPDDLQGILGIGYRLERAE